MVMFVLLSAEIESLRTRITDKDGEIDKFRRGIEKIVKNSTAPVVPLALKGLWNSWFSRRRGKVMVGLPGYFRGRIELIAGEPVPAHEVSAPHLEQMVRNLRGQVQ